MQKKIVNITWVFSSPVVPGLLRYSHCLGSHNLSTRVNSRYGLVFSKLSKRKEITDHLWEGEENVLPGTALPFPRVFPRMVHSASFQHKLWEPWPGIPLWTLWKTTVIQKMHFFSFHTELFKKYSRFSQNEARFLCLFLAAYLYTQSGLAYPQNTGLNLGVEYLAVTFKM